MEMFNKEIKKVVWAIEDLAGMIVDEPAVNDYFVELYGYKVEDNPIYYILDELRERFAVCE